MSVPAPTSDQKSELQPPIRCLDGAPQIFFKSRAPKRGRGLWDHVQLGATRLRLSSYSWYSISQEASGDVGAARSSVRSSEHLFTGIQMRYQFIEQYKQEFPIVVMCHVLEVSESGFYAWFFF